MILFIFAHPDDEAYGPAGTIARLAKTDEVMVVSLCNGARPHNTRVASDRKQAFAKSCADLGAESKIFATKDCKLTYDVALETIEKLIAKYQPTAVYTHSMADIHRDHRLVAECCIVATRPKPGSPVDELYACEMTASTGWSFGQINGSFTPNKFVEVDAVIKKQVLGYYETETYEYPDARSIDSMITLACHRGSQIGVKYAEAFQLVFSRV
jgi:LmbE family N-acetylglucosaminyl deacetylase